MADTDTESARLLLTVGHEDGLDAPQSVGAFRRGLGVRVAAVVLAGAALAAVAAFFGGGVGAGHAPLLPMAGSALGLVADPPAGGEDVADKDDVVDDSTAASKDHGKHKAGKHGDRSKKGHKTLKKKQPWETRKGSFLVVGDWGYDPVSHWQTINNETCVKAIAKKMLESFKSLGDVKFIINVGDSFYPSGVASKDDPQWQKKWRDVFAPELRSVPWYSVYGNHDLHVDPCACTDDLSKCAQINNDTKNLDYFVMPNYTYFQPYPELDMEIIGMDLNYFMEGWNHKLSVKDQGFADCQWTPCKDECYGRSQTRMGASFDLFWQRYEKSTAKNLLVFSHYPTDYFLGGAPAFLDTLRNKTKHDINYFGGHRHSTDTWSTCSIEPNKNWLVGGGGGWSCDSDDQGFVVGNIQEDSSVDTYAVLVDKEVCCVSPTTTPKPSWAWR